MAGAVVAPPVADMEKYDDGHSDGLNLGQQWPSGYQSSQNPLFQTTKIDYIWEYLGQEYISGW